ncbi:hypothetical protein GOP47_0010911 [Adiantum capillus-veneris]|uniref:Uncharacterized protein n=1 Tax=Adiantum capillus-veneris TaxID=13818 RepID=A0A9D4ZJ94_ADICA|nr:hypothetical protein GOP47_0010911 [Adiantum capillus-veneris]
MDSSSNVASPVIVTEGFYDLNEVIMPTPLGPNTMRGAKQLARSRGEVQGECSSKRLKTIREYCERNDASQMQCRACLEDIRRHLQRPEDEDRESLRGELFSTLQHFKDDIARLETNQHEMFSFMENLQNEALQQFSLSFIAHKQHALALKEHVAALGGELISLKMAINRLNAIDKRRSSKSCQSLRATKHEPFVFL